MAPTLVAMNDPWSSLIQALAGAEHVTPGWWPARRVYRTFDEPSPDPRSRTGAAAGTQRKRRADAPKATAPAASAAGTMKLTCPCTNCRRQSAR